MNNQTVNPETLRKRNSKKSETAEKRKSRLNRETELKRQKRAAQNEEKRTERRKRDRERKAKKKAEESKENRNIRLNRERKERNVKRLSRRYHQETPEPDDTDQDERDPIEPETQDRPALIGTISENECGLLQKFRSKLDKIEIKGCPVCNERIPSMSIVNDMCRRCNKEIGTKKFSKDNNMDPGDVPDELQGLTEVEEMLIAQVFTVMSVYRLRGGQYGYRGNVINFSQDIREFTKRLPRTPSSIDILIVRRQSADDLTVFRDFIVRQNKVARALAWLKINNPYYADIIIDEEIIRSLPENGSIINQLPRVSDQMTGEKTDNNNDDEDITRTFVPSQPSTQQEIDAIKKTLNRIQRQDNASLWPEIDGNPINEFQTPGYMVRAFPTLYPHGKGDLRSVREKDINPAEYFKHLMWYKDMRFARHTRWRYFALNSTMRWRALQEGKVYVKQNFKDKQMDVSDIQEMITNGNKQIADRIMRYGEGLRGTRQFWMARRYELTDMIKQIGHQGLIFFTFSAADLHWPELHKLMQDEGHSREETEAAKQRQKNLIENPHMASWFFSKRFEIFFHEVLKKYWDLEDWWYRYEFQHRGSVHVHGIGKRKNAPKIDWNQIKDNEDEMKNVIRYIDSMVSTINPEINAPIPERHPCQKSSSEIEYDLQDYIELINKLQRHTRCSPQYCIRRSKSGQEACRFGFPKELIDRTFIRDDNHGQPELVTSRNDPYINPHNRLQLQGWRANVDLKPVLTIHAALQYISKYASKSEPRSMAFSDIFNQILNKSKPEETSLTSIQKLLINSVTERDISAQETCHLLLSIPLYHSSRNFVTLNINEIAPRWIRGTGNNEDGEEFSSINDSGRTSKSALNIYWERPEALEEYSIFKLYLTHKLTRGEWKSCEKENIVRIRPQPSPLRNGDQWEDFCRVKVILHVPHRSIEQLKENSEVSWATIYNQQIDVINNDPDDVLGSPVDNEKEDLSEDESGEELEEDDEHDEARLDWMVLAEMGPRANIERSCDLGSRDIDRNHDWLNEGRRNYLDDDLAVSSNFIQQASSSDRENGHKSNEKEGIDVRNLNQKQKVVLTRIESHYNDVLMGKQVDPLRIIIMGTAGTGKSYLIRAIRERLQKMSREESEPPVIVIAPTGVAAFNINGTTIHSTLSIPICNDKRLVDIDGERLKQLQKRLHKIHYIIIDEKSMVGRRMLGLIDMRLRQAFSEKKNEPFGGRSIILFGDFGQLPPVLDVPMYSTNISQDVVSNNGMAAYKQFLEVYKLDIIQRQSGESAGQREFRDILLRLRNGESSLNDWRVLTTRFEENLNQSERENFADATSILTKWEEVDKVNIDMLRSLQRPVAKIVGVHSGGAEAKKASSEVAKGLEPHLLLSKGARIMLTANVWTGAGLVNGSMGVIQDIIFEEQGPPSLPVVVFIKFEKYEGPTITNLEGVKVVPIVPIKRTWEGEKGTKCSRLQLPIRLAWAITVHKSQGLTLIKTKIDLGSKEFAAGLSFVATSRVRSLNDIMFKQFTFERLGRIKKLQRLEERKREEERLVSLIRDDAF